MRLLGALLPGVLAAGCALLGPIPLEILPGHRVVLGRVDLMVHGASGAVIEFVRSDGSVRRDLVLVRGRTDFALSLPPGIYRVARVRLVHDREVTGDDPARRVPVTLRVGTEPGTYVGTLRLDGTGLSGALRASAVDEYETTLPAQRARYRGIPDEVARELMSVE